MNLAFLLLATLACPHRPPVELLSPARAVALCDTPTPDPLRAQWAEGVRLTAGEASLLFPELKIDTLFVSGARLTSPDSRLCDGLVLLVDPRLVLTNRRGEPLDVAMVSDAIIGWHAVLAVYREDIHVRPPDGAWLAPDRTTLARVGAVAVGTYSSVSR